MSFLRYAWLSFFSVCAVADLPAVEPFGMRLRPPPRDLASVYEPVVLRESPGNECSLVARRDGTLEIYAVTKPASDTLSVVRSRDGGLTWAVPELAFALPGQAYYAVQVLEAADGTLHAVTHVQGQGPGGYRGRLYEIYHAARPPGVAGWTTPKKIVPGYIGSIRGFVQLASGRLLLSVARAIPERMTAPKSGPDFGWNDTFIYYSDDHGTTWRQSPDQLSVELKAPNVTRYGAIEPVVLELQDQRVWMLVRDRQGRLLESFSDTGGERWPALRPTNFISSDSPAALLRLRDGRIVLLFNSCQNWTNPRSYAMGGREVLHAAISGDDGRTWRGFREVLTEPVAETRGDRGTAYATAAQNAAGKIVVASGQGEGKRAIFAFDPRWLEETEAFADPTFGPRYWTAYGGGGLVSIAVNGKSWDAPLAIAARKDSAGGASWNFPMASVGEISFSLESADSVSAIELTLNDHFTRVDDSKAPENGVFTLPLKPAIGERKVRVRWGGQVGMGMAALEIDGRETGRVAARRPVQFGVNYLRLDFRTSNEQHQLIVRHLTMKSEL